MPLRRNEIPRVVSRVDADMLTRRGKPVIRATVEQFGRRAQKLVDATDPFNVHNPRVTHFINRWGTERITGMVNRTTQIQVRLALSHGVDQGMSYKEISELITHVFDVADSRAYSIASTEIARASNFASWEGYRQAGIEQKEWLSTLSATTRDTHAEMDGQVVDINDEFTSPDGGTAQYPGDFGDPAEDINCQCGVLPVVDERRLHLRGNARKGWFKSFERERIPWNRKLRRALSQGFSEQHDAVQEELAKVSDIAA